MIALIKSLSEFGEMLPFILALDRQRLEKETSPIFHLDGVVGPNKDLGRSMHLSAGLLKIKGATINYLARMLASCKGLVKTLPCIR